WKLYLVLIALFTILISAVMGLTQAAYASQSDLERASDCLIAFDSSGEGIVIDANSGALRKIANIPQRNESRPNNNRSLLSITRRSAPDDQDVQYALYLVQPWLSHSLWLDDLPKGAGGISTSWSPDAQNIAITIPFRESIQPIIYDLPNNRSHTLPLW